MNDLGHVGKHVMLICDFGNCGRSVCEKESFSSFESLGHRTVDFEIVDMIASTIATWTKEFFGFSCIALRFSCIAFRFSCIVRQSSGLLLVQMHERIVLPVGRG